MQARCVTLLLLLVVNLSAQTGPTKVPPRQPQETLAIGSADLNLGMSQDAVLGQLTRAGYKLTEENSNSWTVWQSNPRGLVSLGGVGFKNNTLIFINREWTPDVGTPEAIGNGLYGVLSRMYEQGRKACSLQTNDQQNPTSEVKSIYLTCYPGHSYVSITVVRSQGHESVNVEEILKSE